MNYSKIQTDYPKAFKGFSESFEHSYLDLSALARDMSWDFDHSIRDLYDFFDGNMITVLITCEFDFGFEILQSRYETSYEVKKWFNSRVEAESAAFTKAFEILENKLSNEKV